MDIIIKKAILHILDNTITTPVLSDKEMELEDEILEYLEKILLKIEKSGNNKKCNLELNNEKYNLIKSITLDNFIDITKDISSKLFESILSIIDINPSDYLFVLYIVKGKQKLAILKLNYKESYIHKFEEKDGRKYNRIIKHKASLPSENQTINESVIVEIDTSHLLIREKKYEINDEKKFLFSQIFFNIESDLSTNEKYKVVEKVTKKIVADHFNEEITKAAEIKKIIKENINNSSNISVDDIAKKAFVNNPSMQYEYKEALRKDGLKDEIINANEYVYKKIEKKHKMITDTGIELLFPVEYINDKDKIEMIMNDDGSISILLKKINDIKNK